MSLQLENVFFCCKTSMEALGSCIFTQKNLQILTKTSNTIFSSRDLQFKQNELVFINFVPCIVSKNIKKVFPTLHGIYYYVFITFIYGSLNEVIPTISYLLTTYAALINYRFQWKYFGYIRYGCVLQLSALPNIQELVFLVLVLFENLTTCMFTRA